MNIFEFNEAIKSFDLKQYKLIFQDIEKKRQHFVKHFTLEHIRKMNIDEYIEGKEKSENIFCYALEHTLEAYGTITGSTARKFGIYYKKEQNDYNITKKWNYGSAYKSFKHLREALVELIIAGKNNDLDTIRKSPISPMFKGKILATYYPQKYLNIFSEAHLDYYIHRLDLDHMVTSKTDIIEKRQILVNFKNANAVMKEWPMHAFSHFLYNKYPGAPQKQEKIGCYLKSAVFAVGNFLSVEDNKKSSNPGKGNYIAQQKNREKLGERGEYVVVQHEIKKLKLLKIEKSPIQQSLKDDTLGYDILSYSEDKSPIYIEVKSTNLSPKDFQIYLTANELNTAFKYKNNYHIYIVFNPTSAKPTIVDWGNPFIKKDRIKLIPTQYKIHLKRI